MFYICIFAMNLVAGSMIILGVIPDFSTVMGSGVTDMTGSMMGIGMAFMIVGIFFALFTCTEFSTGFAKNIFARHSNPFRYISGKLLSLTVSGSIMIVAFTLVSMILLFIAGSGVALPGGLGGLIAFLFGKMLYCAAYAAIVLLVCVYTRKSVAGVIVAVLVAMSVVPMLLGIAGHYFNTAFLSEISNFTVSGLSAKLNLVFHGKTFITAIIGSLLWTAICGVLGAKLAKLKDI